MYNQAKYFKIAEDLRKDIFRSRFGKKLPNNVELAKIYNTTPITIRKSLRILEESGTVEIRPTKGGTVVSDDMLSRRKSRSIALVGSEVFNSIENVHFQKLYASAQNYLEKNGNYQLQIENVPACEEGRKKAFERLREMFRMGFYDGLIAMNIFSVDEINHFLHEKIPFVVIGNSYGCNIPSVRHDDEALAGEIISELERGQANKAAILCKPPSVGKEPDPKSSLGRLIKWLSERGLIADDRIRFIKFGGEFEKAEKVTKELLDKDPDIDLFITYGSNMSRGAYTVLKSQPSFTEGKMRLLPITDEDVIGDFPNLLIAVRETGETVAKILIDAIDGKLDQSGQRHLLKPYWSKTKTEI